MDRKDFTPEQLAKAAACKTTEELLQLAKEEGIELSDDDLAQVSGGYDWGYEHVKCPACGSEDIYRNSMMERYVCRSCGHAFE